MADVYLLGKEGLGGPRLDRQTRVVERLEQIDVEHGHLMMLRAVIDAVPRIPRAFCVEVREVGIIGVALEPFLQGIERLRGPLGSLAVRRVREAH